MRCSILFGESFGEAEDIGFAGVISGHHGAREKAGGACDIDEPRFGELEEEWNEPVRQVGEDTGIEVEKFEVFAEGDLVEWTVETEPGVIDELVYWEVEFGELRVELSSCTRSSEVKGDGFDIDVMSVLNTFCGLGEIFLIAGNEN